MAILGLYDILSIQKYVYSSSRLRDNIGAAMIVDKCLDDYIKKALDNLGEKYENNKDSKEFKAYNNQEIKIETIYSGGGNALIYFENIELYKKLNFELSKIFIENAPGIKFITTYIETDFNEDFGQDVNYLFKKLQLKKYNKKDTNLAKCISITRECQFTKAPATTLINGEYISDELFVKRNETKDNYDSKYKDMEDLAGIEGEKFIAVVHIDGNNMGKQLNEYLKECDNYQDGVIKIRNFSKYIQDIYDNAYETMTKEIKMKIDNKDNEKINKYKGEDKEVPFRKIYIKGDDVTFICYAPIALKAVEIFLNEISNNKKLGIELSACCGIAYVKPTYPFNIAYSISEQCCSYAKKVAKATANYKDVKVGNYVDFYLAHSNMLGDISNNRKCKYNMEFLNREANEGLGRSYNLMLRPYEVSENKKEITNLDTLFKISKWIQDSKVSKSKLKVVRNAYITNLYKLKQSFMDLRGQKKDNKELEKLYDQLKNLNCNLDKEFFMDMDKGICVLYDALELMDLYIEM